LVRRGVIFSEENYATTETAED